MISQLRHYIGESVATIRNGWDRFWFTPSDPATLCAIRIMAGLMLCYTHLVWGLNLVGFFGEAGQLTSSFARQMHASALSNDQAFWAWSHLYGIQSPGALWTVHLIAIVLLIMFTAGLWTRWTGWCAFLITASYAHRAVGALFGLDQINGFLALYLAIGPSGALYSVDAWRAKRKGRAGEPAMVSATVAIRLIQCHMCVVYLFAGLGKLLGPSWWAGTALWGAFANFEYQTLDMTWVAGYPLIVNFLTQLTLAWEISYIALVWPRLTRPVMIALAVPLHLGIAFCMGMITFGLIMIVGNFAFVSPELVRSFMGGWKEAHRPAERIDAVSVA